MREGRGPCRSTDPPNEPCQGSVPASRPFHIEEKTMPEFLWRLLPMRLRLARARRQFADL